MSSSSSFRATAPDPQTELYYIRLQTNVTKDIATQIVAALPTGGRLASVSDGINTSYVMKTAAGANAGGGWVQESTVGAAFNTTYYEYPVYKDGLSGPIPMSNGFPGIYVFGRKPVRNGIRDTISTTLTVTVGSTQYPLTIYSATATSYRRVNVSTEKPGQVVSTIRIRDATDVTNAGSSTYSPSNSYISYDLSGLIKPVTTLDVNSQFNVISPGFGVSTTNMVNSSYKTYSFESVMYPGYYIAWSGEPWFSIPTTNASSGIKLRLMHITDIQKPEYATFNILTQAIMGTTTLPSPDLYMINLAYKSDSYYYNNNLAAPYGNAQYGGSIFGTTQIGIGDVRMRFFGGSISVVVGASAPSRVVYLDGFGSVGSSSSSAARIGSSSSSAARIGSSSSSNSSKSVLFSNYKTPEVYVITSSIGLSYNTIINELIPQFPSGTRIATSNDIKSENATGKLTNFNGNAIIVDSSNTPAIILSIQSFIGDETAISPIEDYTIDDYTVIYLYGLKPINKTPELTTTYNPGINEIYDTYIEKIKLNNISSPVDINIIYNKSGIYSNNLELQLASSSSSAVRQLASSSSSGGLPGVFGSSSSSFKGIGSSSSSFAPFGSSSSSAAQRPQPYAGYSLTIGNSNITTNMGTKFINYIAQNSTQINGVNYIMYDGKYIDINYVTDSALNYSYIQRSTASAKFPFVNSGDIVSTGLDNNPTDFLNILNTNSTYTTLSEAIKAYRPPVGSSSSSAAQRPQPYAGYGLTIGNSNITTNMGSGFINYLTQNRSLINGIYYIQYGGKYIDINYVTDSALNYSYIQRSTVGAKFPFVNSNDIVSTGLDNNPTDFLNILNTNSTYTTLSEAIKAYRPSVGSSSSSASQRPQPYAGYGLTIGNSNITTNMGTKFINYIAQNSTQINGINYIMYDGKYIDITYVTDTSVTYSYIQRSTVGAKFPFGNSNDIVSTGLDNNPTDFLNILNTNSTYTTLNTAITNYRPSVGSSSSSATRIGSSSSSMAALGSSSSSAARIGSSSSSAAPIGSSSSSLWSPFGSSSSSAAPIGSSSSSDRQIASSSSSAARIGSSSSSAARIGSSSSSAATIGSSSSSAARIGSSSSSMAALGSSSSSAARIGSSSSSMAALGSSSSSAARIGSSSSSAATIGSSSSSAARIGSSSSSARQIASSSSSAAPIGSSSSSMARIGSSSSSAAPIGSSSSSAARIGSSSSSAATIGSSSSSAARIGSSSSSARQIASSSSSARQIASSSSSAAPIGSSSSSMARIGSSSSSAAPIGSSSSSAVRIGSSSSSSTSKSVLFSNYKTPEVYVITSSIGLSYNTIINELIPQFPSGTRIATSNDIKSENATGKLTNFNGNAIIVDSSNTPAIILSIQSFIGDETAISPIEDYTIDDYTVIYLYGLKPINKTPELTTTYNPGINEIYDTYIEKIKLNNISSPVDINIIYNKSGIYSNNLELQLASSSSSGGLPGVFGSSSSSFAPFGSSSSSAATIGSSSSSMARIGSSSSSAAPIGSSSSSMARIGSSSSSMARIGSSSSSAAPFGSSSSSAAQQLASSSSSGGLPGVFGSSSSSFKGIGSSSSSAAPFGSSSSSAAPFGSSSSSAAPFGSSSSSAVKQLASSSSSVARIGSSSSSAVKQLASSSSSVARIGSSSSSARQLASSSSSQAIGQLQPEIFYVQYIVPKTTPVMYTPDNLLSALRTKLPDVRYGTDTEAMDISYDITGQPGFYYDTPSSSVIYYDDNDANNTQNTIMGAYLYGVKPQISSDGYYGYIPNVAFGTSNPIIINFTVFPFSSDTYSIVNSIATKRIGSSSSSAARIGSSSSSMAHIGSSSSSAAPFGSSSSSMAPIGSSSSSAAPFGSSSSSPMFSPFGSSSSSAALFGGLPGMGTIGSEYVSPRGSSSSYYSPLDILTGAQQQQQQQQATTTLPPQIYPVSFTSGAPITQANILAILLSLNARLATLEDVYTALGFGLNWCYPTYVQKSTTDTSIVIYAASQPGKCGPSSGRQMIKVQVQDNSQPQFVFVFGRKPADETTIMTTAGEIVAGNFYEPIAGTSGFRNMYPSMEGQGLVQTRYDASKLYESFFATTTCYNALDCPLPAVQTLAQETTAGTTTIDSPIQVSLPTLTASSTTPQGSSSYETSIADAKPAAVIISSVTTTTSVSPVVPSPTTLANLQATYITTAKQGSSSSYTPTSIGGSGSAAAKDTAATQTQTAAKTSTAPATKASTTQVTKTIVAAAPAPQQKVKEIQYVAKPGVAAMPEKSELTYYDPNAGFFSNLLGEFVYDFGRVLKGVRAATT